jgi:hypothetical protein
MATTSSQEQGPLHRLLTPHLPIIHVVQGLPARVLRGHGRCRREPLPAGQKIHHLGQILHGVKLQTLDHPGLPGIFPGENKAQTSVPGGQGNGQHPPGGLEAAVQGEFAEEEIFIQALRRHHPLGRQQPHGHGQVKPRPLLAHVGGSQIDGHPIARKLEA